VLHIIKNFINCQPSFDKKSYFLLNICYDGEMDMIASRLKEFREANGYNQEGMAKLGNMTQEAWSGWERQSPKALRSLVAIARHFGVSTDYLLGLIEKERPIKDIEGISKIMSELPEEKRRQILDYAEYLASTEKNKSESSDGVGESQTYEGKRLQELFLLVQRILGVDARKVVEKIARNKGMFPNNTP
jgi:transcriptional regulator with XRE-family HTH domain